MMYLEPMAKPKNRMEEIVVTSAELFRRRGFPATSIRDIGDALGITSAALYYHFKNKDEVLLGVMRVGLNAVSEAVNQAVAECDGSAWDKIHAAVRSHIRFALEHQNYAIVLLQELRHLSDESRREIIRERDTYDALWEELLEQAQADGLLSKDVEPNLLRLMLFGAINYVVVWYKPKGPLTPQQIADAFTEYLGNGVLKKT